MMSWREYQALQRVMVLGERYLSYVDQGQGEAVVLLHGIPTWGYLWAQSILPLSRSFRVLVPDLLGYGYSDKSDRFERSLSAQAAAIEEWLERLGVRRAALVGHDVGGGIALRLALDFPARVSGLCLLNSVSYDSWPIEPILQFSHPRADRAISARTAGVLLRRMLRLGCHRLPEPEVLEGLVAPYLTEVGKLSLIRDASSLDTNGTMALASRLAALELPALVLWGERDRFQKVEYGRRLAWDLPHSRFVGIPDARHFVMLDRPDAVIAELEKFLTSAPSSRATAA
ncbi:MAG: alpha/beta hydrolase [Oligoflexia bacterium]|nr:alpha/beta hydrolase [Oligoflexia bacterium]